MKTDAIIIGAELDGLLAAAYLLEQGHTVQILSSGAGSLHYAPAGIHVLGYTGEMGSVSVSDPIAAISQLGSGHPYRIVGTDTVLQSLEWFKQLCERLSCPVQLLNQNKTAISPIGLGVPMYGAFAHQATIDALRGRSVAIVNFERVKDFPSGLLAKALGDQGISTRIVEVALPAAVSESVGLAKSFDSHQDLQAYFASMKNTVPFGTGVVLFPAVLGLESHQRVLATAQQALGMPCLEVPLLPPSVPGLRLEKALRRHLYAQAAEVNANIRISSSTSTSDGIRIEDANGRIQEAHVAILATGGVLMGGIEISSTGSAKEPLFGLRIHQGQPLSASSVGQTLDALHRTGVEVNHSLCPASEPGLVIENIFVTGRTLAHWNPSEESSYEGVAISTGWFAAQHACQYIRRKVNG